MAVRFLRGVGDAARAAAQSVSAAQRSIRENTRKIEADRKRLEELAQRREELLDRILAETRFENVIEALVNQDDEMRRRAQLIRQGVQEEALRMQDLLDLLGNVNTLVARQIEQIIRLREVQAITTDGAISELEKIRRRLGPNSIDGALAKGLEDQLRQAQRNGTI